MAIKDLEGEITKALKAKEKRSLRKEEDDRKTEISSL